MFYLFIVYVPTTHAAEIRLAIANAGDGKIGNYSYCSFSSKGLGHFLPEEYAKPFIGNVRVLKEVEEEKIEILCNTEDLQNIISAVKKTHPYEEPVYFYSLVINTTLENTSSKASEQPLEEKKGEQLKLPFKEKQ